MKPFTQVLLTAPLGAILLMGVMLLFQAPCAAEAATFTQGPGNYQRSLTSGGRERSYAVHVPQSYNPAKPTPVILNFHGGGGNPHSERTISMMDESSERYGYIVVYPQGTGAKFRLINPHGYTWNAGSCCGWAMKHHIDDVAYTNALLDDLERQFNVDKKRVFATGISNGGMMCFRLACQLSNRIAAIAPISGPMGFSNCNPPRPVSVIYFQGTADKFVPIGGGPGRLPGEFFESADQTIAFWRLHDKITGKPRVVRRGQATGYYYGPGADGSEVALWVIQGGGHTWPGGQYGFLGKRILGAITHDISANDLMWEFFQKHPLK